MQLTLCPERPATHLVGCLRPGVPRSAVAELAAAAYAADSWAPGPSDAPLSFPVSVSLPAFVAALRGRGLTVDVPPAWVLDGLREWSCPPTPAAEVTRLLDSLPPRLYNSLHPHQREGLAYMLHRGGRALLADGMGLGKTVTALAAAHFFLRDGTVLIVCPTTLVGMWQAEALKWLPDDLSPEDVTVVRSGADVKRLAAEAAAVADAAGAGHGDGFRPLTRVTIISDTLLTILPPADRPICDSIVLDEAHRIRNPEAARTMALVPMVQRARGAVLVTGTPAVARPADLFTLLHALAPGLFPTRAGFLERYCGGTGAPVAHSSSGPRRGPVWRAAMTARVGRGSSNAAELAVLLRATIMTRQAEKVDLPPKTREWVCLPIPEADLGRVKEQGARVAKANRAVKKAEATLAAHPSTKAEDEAHAAAQQLKQAHSMWHMASAKAKRVPVAEYVVKVVRNAGGDGKAAAGGAPPAKVLVFGRHQCMLDALTERLAADGIGHMRLDGRTPARARYAHVHQFQTDPAVRVAVLQFDAGGLGLTLTAATTVVFAELWWTPATMDQAEDRAHRIGQTAPVRVVYLSAPGTMDPELRTSLATKRRAVVGVVDAKGAVGGHVEAHGHGGGAAGG